MNLNHLIWSIWKMSDYGVVKTSGSGVADEEIKKWEQQREEKRILDLENLVAHTKTQNVLSEYYSHRKTFDIENEAVLKGYRDNHLKLVEREVTALERIANALGR